MKSKLVLMTALVTINLQNNMAYGQKFSGYTASILEHSLDQTLSQNYQDFQGVLASDIKFNEFENLVKSPEGVAGLGFAQLVDTYRVNGLAIVIIENGEITQERYYGYEKADRRTPIDVHTRFQAASMSKYVAGLTAAIAAEEGHIPLGKKVSVLADANPSSLLDEWRDKKFKGSEKDYPESISLKRLLNHSAGLDTWGIGTTPQNENKTMEKILIGDGLFWTKDGVMPQNVPGVERYYSGGGYTVAELMIEIATGRTFSDYASEVILDAANMGKSTFEEIDEHTPDMAWGHSYGATWSPEKTLVKAAGGLIATPKNYAKLLFPIMDWGLNKAGNQLFSRAVMEEVLTPAFHKDSSKLACTVDSNCPTMRNFNLGTISIQVPVTEQCFKNKCQEFLESDGISYGLGVYLKGNRLSDGFHRYIDHGGAHDGFRSQFRVDRQERNGVEIMINGTRTVSINGNENYGSNGLLDEIYRVYKSVY